MQQQEYLRSLLKKYITGSASAAEREELFASLAKDEMRDEWIRIIEDLSHGIRPDGNYDEEEWKPVIRQILDRGKIPERISDEEGSAPVRHIRWWWAAASAVLLLGAGSYFLFFNKTVVQHPQPVAVHAHDVAAPQTNRATITLANGQKIFLDSAGNGTLATQNSINIIKTADGKIAYRAASSGSPGRGATAVNTLANPRGSRVIDIMLSDGSRVWLNAGSSVTYPVAFTGKERKVTITGEAYFEVKHDDKMPFTVSANDVEIHDLGTSFNVNAYNDEDAIRVTLLKGSVRLVQNSKDPKTAGAQSKILRPGDQGIVRPSAFSIVHNADLDQAMAWKNGYFNFNQQPVTEIMKELGRWYDVQVVYEGEKPDDLFSAIVKRDNNVSQVLKKFEETNRVHFKIEDRKVIVTK